ncbi:GATA zinc finger domain-containing protein 8 [Gracilariopsis chorda]|uniref:GATA zinc finger domain-containing protein 8 n=1 Tax=Gracilariopsis chorda TaxID=448386 RepID=A0A2V3J6X8_9FLOR|nr:GATA zinc finger domain-containing protein 8 [Gracilariopsis chorda]|eukprot:PXF49130.1 GATA zinc finger domain-containing protein 8 [Gracilariopsis chorda]
MAGYLPAPSASASPIPRVCQNCGTTETSQWRYGPNNDTLLCNACGIRWKRKNRRPDSERVKPGPKRTLAPHACANAQMDLSKLLSPIEHSPSSVRKQRSCMAISELLNDDVPRSPPVPRASATSPNKVRPPKCARPPK